jgi:hypothetical protein
MLSALTYVWMSMRILPWAGFPLPIAFPPGQHVNLQVFWIDGIVSALLLVYVTRQLD